MNQAFRTLITVLLLNMAAMVSAYAAPADGSHIDNQASASFDVASVRQSNSVRTVTGAAQARPAFDVNLRVMSGDVAQDQQVTLAVSATNTGANSDGIDVWVDGVQQALIVLAQPIPADTTLVSAQAAPNARLLYHVRNTAALRFLSVAPSDLTEVDTVVYAYQTFAAGESSENWFTIARDTGAVLRIEAAAQVWFDDSATDGADMAPSNAVQINFLRAAPRINFYTNNAFERVAPATAQAGPLYVEAIAAVCNMSATAADTVKIMLASRDIGDWETFDAVETGPNTGVFRIPHTVLGEDIDTHKLYPNDGSVETNQNDVISATLSGCGDNTVTTTVLVDPYGVLFDSSSNEPVGGATVSLIDVDGNGNGGNAGGLARVFFEDGVTPAPSTVVTDANGEYHFPLVPASRYRLQVKPAVGYSFPSTVAATDLPAGRTIDTSASYGGEFAVTAELGIVQIDVPLDATAVDGLLVEKTVSKGTAEIGDFVDYTISIKNTSGTAFRDLTLRDVLPAGFAYQKNTLRRDGVRTADPASTEANIVFNLGVFNDGDTTKLRYRVKLGPNAQLGDGINRATAYSTLPRARSNTAEAKVNVEGGVFSERGFVLGKIFADCNGDKIQNAGEPGVPGVRVWLEDGTYAITDGLGKYSFYGLSPRTHVAKIDAATVPAGAQFVALDQRNAGRGDSRFIDLKNGELARADFAIAQCDTAMRDTLAQRAEQLRLRGGEIEAGVNAELSLDNTVIDPRSKAASGVVSTQKQSTQKTAQILASEKGRAAIASVEAAILAQRPLSEVAESFNDNTLDFVGLAEGVAVNSTQQRVLVKGLLGAQLGIVVNGKPVAQSHLGTQVTRAEKQFELLEFIGVELQPGDNTLTVEQRDPFGNLRASKTIRVRAPGELHHIRIERARTANENDSAIAVFLEDSNGLSVTSRTSLTLETDRGDWAVADLNPAEAGTQVFVEGGHAEFTLHAPEARDNAANVKVSSGNVVAETRVDFLAPLRDMVAVGVIEGTLKLGKLGSGALQPARRSDGFEQELKQFSYDNGHAAARAAVFLKGKIKGDYLLTLGYDSDKQTRERLFRDIQPDQFYPVYGDSSIKGYDAQSTQKLYVRVDKNKSWLLYGDFTTQGATPERTLTAYNRSLTGVRQHYENERLSVNTFASHDSTRQVVEELPANGTSGPFILANNDLIENSEQIEIITRDRNQPGVVIQSVPMQRFADYELEPFSGRILFRAPIPTYDADLNQNFIRITYEVDSGGEEFWVGGADAQFKINQHVSVGAVDIEDRDPADEASLRGVNTTIKLGDKTSLVGEVARSEKFTVGNGDAQRIELKHDSEKTQARIFAGRADEDFYNPSATLSRGRSEAGAKIARKLDEKTRLIADALHSGDIASGASRDGVLIGAEHGFDNNVKLELGVRRTHEVAGDFSGLEGDTDTLTTNVADPTDLAAPGSTTDTTSIRTKIGAPVPGLKTASMYGEYEQSIDDSDEKLAAVGGEYRMTNSVMDNARIYGRHEFISSLSGPYNFDSNTRRDTTVFGVDNEYMKDGRAYSEYRSHDAFSGREAEAAMGLKNQFQVADGVRINTSAERVRALQGGTEQNEATALAGGVEYTADPDWKGSARLEWRNAPNSTGILNTVGVARKIDEEWTFLGRNIYNRIDNDGEAGGDRLQDRLQLGFAFRDAETNKVNGLGRYEFKHEQDDTADTGYWHQAHVVSLQANIQAQRSVVFSTRYAGKYAVDRTDGVESAGVTHLVSGRATWDFMPRWDVGVQVSTLFSGDDYQRGLGVELGHQVQDNLWVSVGYNIFGFEDRDLADANSERGAYLRLRFKFDENSFEGFK